MATNDGLKRREWKADHFNTQGGSVFGYATASGGDVFVAGSIRMQERGVPIANTGSPASQKNYYIQAGSDATGAGSTAWVVLPEGFADSTYFITYGVRGTADRAVTHVAGSTNTGSFFAISHGGASVVFDWQAVGTK